MKEICTHFFGFRGDEYNRAKKIWVNQILFTLFMIACILEIDKEKDILIFANKERPDVFSKYRRGMLT